MITEEFESCLMNIKSYYPDFELHGAWMSKWFGTFKRYSRSEVMEALDQWVVSPNRFNGNLHSQKIALFKTFVDEAAKRQRGTFRTFAEEDEAVERNPEVKQFRKTSPIEFCMDVLEVPLVKEELKGIVGHPEAVKWNELIADRAKCAKVREKIDELFETAKQFNPTQYERRFGRQVTEFKRADT